MDELDVVIIGAGVVGLAVGRAFALSGREVTVIESQSTFGTQISARNSEVIHAGIYYPTNSLKAHLCVSGKTKLYDYCKERAIAHKAVGKLIVATDKSEIATLLNYQHQASQNGVTDLCYLSATQLRDSEPELQAVAGLLSPSTGIIDSYELMMNFTADLSNQGATLLYNSTVTGGQLKNTGPIITISGAENCSVQCRLLVNCGGLSAPEIAKKLGIASSLTPPIYFAKGHYYNLSGPSPFSHLVYPLAANAGLGIHSTLNLANQLRFGPDVQWIDKLDYRFDESRKNNFIDAIKRYYPGLDGHALEPSYTGIRPKLVGPNSTPGDFLIQDESQHGHRGLINCYGIESPGLTASMALAEHIVRHCR